VYEASHPRKDGKKDSDQSGKEFIGNAIATKKNCLFFKEEAKKEVEQVMNKMLSDPPPELM